MDQTMEMEPVFNPPVLCQPQPPQTEVQKGSVFDSLQPKIQGKVLSIQGEINDRMQSIKTNVYEIGKLLAEAKEILGYGKFKPWIEETWGKTLPYSTAALYKAVFEKFAGRPDVVEAFPLTFLQQVKQGTFPDTVLETILDDPQAFSKEDIHTLQEEARLRKELYAERCKKLEVLWDKRNTKPVAVEDAENYDGLDNTPKNVVPGVFTEVKCDHGKRKFLVFFFDSETDYDLVLAHLIAHGKKFKRHPHMDSRKLVDMVKQIQDEVDGELAANI